MSGDQTPDPLARKPARFTLRRCRAILCWPEGLLVHNRTTSRPPLPHLIACRPRSLSFRLACGSGEPPNRAIRAQSGDEGDCLALDAHPNVVAQFRMGKETAAIASAFH